MPATHLDRLFGAAARAPRNAARGLVRAYQLSLSPLVGFHCRHVPTCSVYADEVLARFGLWAGGWMTLGRLCRCHPFGTSGLDLAPAARPERARWFLPWRYARWRDVSAGTQCPVSEVRDTSQQPPIRTSETKGH